MIRSPERTEFLSDILTTAIEGGVGYWSHTTHYQYVWIDGSEASSVGHLKPGKGTCATIYNLEDDAKAHHITINTIARGLSRIIGGTAKTGERYAQRIAQASRENDAGMIDSGDADNIVQAGLFGELVYG